MKGFKGFKQKSKSMTFNYKSSISYLRESNLMTVSELEGEVLGVWSGDYKSSDVTKAFVLLLADLKWMGIGCISDGLKVINIKTIYPDK